MSLDAEVALFESRRAEWLAGRQGQFVLIKGSEFSFHESDDDAYTAAISKYGNVDVLIRKVAAVDVNDDPPALVFGLINATT